MRKLFALLAGILLVVSVLAGCGQEQNAALDAGGGQSALTQQEESFNYRANSGKISVEEGAAYNDKIHVAAYINQFAKLPHNYITKGEAKKMGWKKAGTLDKVAPGKSIGGDRYGNYEGKLPDKKGRKWKECDIDYVKGNRNAKRIVYSNDGLIYYSGDHYKNFERLY